MTELTQKTLGTSKKISIETDCLLVQTKSVKEELEYKIKFEELGFDIIKKRIKTANIPFYFMLLLVLLCLGLLIDSVATHEVLRKQVFWIVGLIFFSMITISTYYHRNKDVIYLTGGRNSIPTCPKPPTVVCNYRKTASYFY
jgi:hypothetical protein